VADSRQLPTRASPPPLLERPATAAAGGRPPRPAARGGCRVPSVYRRLGGRPRARQRAWSVARPLWWRWGDSNSAAPISSPRGQGAVGGATCGFHARVVTLVPAVVRGSPVGCGPSADQGDEVAGAGMHLGLSASSDPARPGGLGGASGAGLVTWASLVDRAGAMDEAARINRVISTRRTLAWRMRTGGDPRRQGPGRQDRR
jgi:hypothetical protein